MASLDGDNAGETIEFLSLEEVSRRLDPARTVVVSDSHVHRLHGAAFSSFPAALLPEGEAAKSWDVLKSLFLRFIELGVDRTWTVFALGGGSASDIAGFAAHLWMRGIGYSSAPTTLLAMVDAGLGGKNGIDFGGYKNVLGSFQRPKAVYCDMETLRTLPGDQFASGMAEAVKHGIIDGEGYFGFLESLAANFDHRAADPTILRRIVAESQRIKLGIVDSDPRETGRRRVLNLGHSFGHGIEVEAGIPHGYAVSLGIGIACAFSVFRKAMAEDRLRRILALLSSLGLPIRHEALAKSGFRSRVAQTLLMDKKRSSSMLRFVLPRDIGDVDVVQVDIGELIDFFEHGGFLEIMEGTMAEKTR